MGLEECDSAQAYASLQNTLPYLVSEFSNLALVVGIEGESGLGFDENTRLELSSAEKDRSQDMRVLIEHILYHT